MGGLSAVEHAVELRHAAAGRLAAPWLGHDDQRIEAAPERDRRQQSGNQAAAAQQPADQAGGQGDARGGEADHHDLPPASSAADGLAELALDRPAERVAIEPLEREIDDMRSQLPGDGWRRTALSRPAWA